MKYVDVYNKPMYIFVVSEYIIFPLLVAFEVRKCTILLIKFEEMWSSL